MKTYRTNDKHTYTCIWDTPEVERIFNDPQRHVGMLRPYETCVHNCPIMAIGSKKNGLPIYHRWPKEVEARVSLLSWAAHVSGLQDIDYTASIYLYDLPGLWEGDPNKIYGYHEDR